MATFLPVVFAGEGLGCLDVCRSQSATNLWIIPTAMGFPLVPTTQAASQRLSSWGQQRAVVPGKALVSLTLRYAVWKSPLATASHMPLMSVWMGQTSMQTGLGQLMHLSASAIASSLVYGS